MSRHVGVGIEGISAYGAAVTPTDFFEALTESLKKNINNEEIGTIRGNSILQVNALNEFIDGDVVVQGNFQDIGLLLKAFIGTADSGAGPPYTHTFPSSGGTTGRAGISLTTEVKRDSDARTWQYAGCKVTGYSLSATLDQSPQLTFGMIGKSETQGAGASASYPTFDPMLVQDMSISFDATALPAQTIELSSTWDVDQPFKIGSSTFAFEPIDSDWMKVEGTVQVIMTDTEMTEYDKFGSTTPIDIILTVDDGTHSIIHNLNKTKLTAVNTNLDGKGRLLGTFNFKSYFDTAATESMQILLTNDDVDIPDPA
jgi:hypothetical protein